MDNQSEESLTTALQKTLTEKCADQDMGEKRIKKIIAGNTYILVLYHTGELFEGQWEEKEGVEISQLDVPTLTAYTPKTFKGRYIHEISGTFLQYMAMEREYIKPISEWDYIQIA